MRLLAIGIFGTFMLLVFTAQASQFEYEVTVLDEQGAPLVGVSVFTDDYRFADVTDAEGKVRLKNLRYNDVVHFSYLGYQPLSLPFYEIRQRGGIIRLQPQVTALTEVVVIGRRDDAPEELPWQIEQVDQKAMALSEPQTTADALAAHTNVFVQKTQMGGGSIVLRGFEANRVLLVVDGVRMNNAIYRNGHLQNAITVDNTMLDRIEVIFGPGSLLYGSDALGGVVHFRSQDPKLYFGPDPKGYRAQTHLMSRYASANKEKTLSWHLNFGKQRWGTFTSFRFSDYGDLHAGSNRPPAHPDFGLRKYFVRRVGQGDQVLENGYWKVVRGDSIFITDYDDQVGTAYHQIDLTQKWKYQPSSNFYLLANFQFSSTGKVPRYDKLTLLGKKGTERDLKFAEWNYGPQKRLLASLKAQLRQGGSVYDKATLIAAYQKIDEDRLKRKLNKEYRTFQLEDVYVYSFTADFDKKVSAHSGYAFGFDFQHNIVHSTAGRVSLRTQYVFRDELTRYPSGGSRLTATGGYLTYYLQTRDSLMRWQAGLRYTSTTLFARFKADDLIQWPQLYVQGISTRNDALTWSVGLIVQPWRQWRIQLLAATAFRAPNVDDFGKIREKNGYVTIPNPALLPEETTNVELSLSKHFGQTPNSYLSWRTTVYYTQLRNAMVRTPMSLPHGSTTLWFDEEELVTIANVNATEGFVYGLSGQLQARWHQWFVQAHASYTKGRRRFYKTFEAGPIAYIDTLVPLDHIPPFFGQLSAGWEAQRVRLACSLRHNSRKPLWEYAVSDIKFDDQGQMIIDRRGTADNLEYTPKILDEEGKTTYAGTYAWTIINIQAAVRLGSQLWAQASVENLTDLHYRPFASGISAPGRNFVFSLRAQF